ncbi:MAG TPA: DinB family protein [Ktedonobacterales bacterium]
MAQVTYEVVAAISRRFGANEVPLEVEAHDFTLAELHDGLRDSRAVLQSIADTWDDTQLHARPPLKAGAGEEERWSAAGVLSHLCVTQNWYMLNMDRLLGQRHHYASMPQGLGDQAQHEMPKAQLAPLLRASTGELLTYIAAIPATADLEATRDSRFFGDLGLRGWVLLAIVHDYDHLGQLRSIARMAGFGEE